MGKQEKNQKSKYAHSVIWKLREKIVYIDNSNQKVGLIIAVARTQKRMIKWKKWTASKSLAIIGRCMILCCLVLFGLKFILHFWEIELPSTFYVYVPFQCGNENEVCNASAPQSATLKVTITYSQKSNIHQSSSLFVSISTTSNYVDLVTPEAGQTQLNSAVTADVMTVQFEAQLSASAFDIDPQKQTPVAMPTKMGDLFGWSLIPKYVGPQTLLVSIVALDSQGSHTLAIAVLHVTVNAAKAVTVANITSDPNAAWDNFLNLSQVTLGGLLATLLGSALNIPWIVEAYRKKKEIGKEKQKIQQSSPLQTVGASPSMALASSPPAKKKKKRVGQHKRP